MRAFVIWLTLLSVAQAAPLFDAKCTFRIYGSGDVGASSDLSAYVRCSGPNDVPLIVAPALARLAPTFIGTCYQHSSTSWTVSEEI